MACRIVNRPGCPSGLAGEFPALPSGRSSRPASYGNGKNRTRFYLNGWTETQRWKPGIRPSLPNRRRHHWAFASSTVLYQLALKFILEAGSPDGQLFNWLIATTMNITEQIINSINACKTNTKSYPGARFSNNHISRKVLNVSVQTLNLKALQLF